MSALVLNSVLAAVGLAALGGGAVLAILRANERGGHD